MSSSEQFQSIEAMHSAIITRASEDAEFRAALLENPRMAINEAYDMDFPEIFDIVVHESKGTSLHLALPPQLDALDEEQLAAISAGQSGLLCIPGG